MTFSTDLITQLIDYTNKDAILSKLGKAIRAYDTEGLPVPIRETYFSFSCKENSVRIIVSDEGIASKENTVTIRMNCFSPLKKSAYSAHSLSEKVTAGLSEKFSQAVTGFSVGDTQYDDDVKSYKITALITFRFNS
ncbi:MAG: hypothetical protein IJW86_07450 [Clostridia bacterium]|nr:hypothetical protein [Clostridia bacterium]